jgi:hypothetical protein
LLAERLRHVANSTQMHQFHAIFSRLRATHVTPP